MASIKTWNQNGMTIYEVDFDGDRRAFEIYVDCKHVATIYPDSPEDTENIRIGLNLGEDVRDYENGHGRSIGTLIAERTGAGLRETLRRLEEERKCYTYEFDGRIVWVDEINGVNNNIYYEYEPGNLDLRVDDLTDEDLKNIRIWGL